MPSEKWSGVPSVDVAGSQEPRAESYGPRAGIFARAVLLLIRVYQVFFSPLNISSCRYYPSCSRYTYEAIEKFGARKGAWLGLRRVLRCHPFSPGGFDPVPDLDSASHEGHSHDEHSPEAHLRNNTEGHRQQGFVS